jgi:small conductance mechanosensitive channel
MLVPMDQHFDRITTLLTTALATYGMNVLGAILTLILGFALAGWLSRMVHRAMQRSSHVDPIFKPLPGKAVRVAVIVITVIAVLNRFGVQTTSLIAVLGAAGLAIGLALQGTLSNVAAGVMLLVFRPFKIGDAVKVAGDTYIIDAIGFFICRAHTPDGPSAFLPNASVWGQTIVNYSVTSQDRRRIDEVYGIGYGDDIGVAIAILTQVAAAEGRVLTEPPPLIKVESLGDSSVNILFRVWTERANWWETKLDLLRACKEALDKGGVNIPFPQRDVHLIPAPGAASA